MDTSAKDRCGREGSTNPGLQGCLISRESWACSSSLGYPPSLELTTLIRYESMEIIVRRTIFLVCLWQWDVLLCGPECWVTEPSTVDLTSYIFIADGRVGALTSWVYSVIEHLEQKDLPLQQFMNIHEQIMITYIMNDIMRRTLSYILSIFSRSDFTSKGMLDLLVGPRHQELLVQRQRAAILVSGLAAVHFVPRRGLKFKMTSKAQQDQTKKELQSFFCMVPMQSSHLILLDFSWMVVAPLTDWGSNLPKTSTSRRYRSVCLKVHYCCCNQIILHPDTTYPLHVQLYDIAKTCFTMLYIQQTNIWHISCMYWHINIEYI